MENIISLDLDKLKDAQKENSVSIYIAASGADPDTKENEHRIKLKNKAKEAKETLIKKGFEEKDAENYLKPVYDIIEDSQMLRSLWGGLAIYLNKDYFDFFNVVGNWEDVSYVGDEFYLSPVIEPIAENRSFFVISINLSKVQLYKANRFDIKEIEVEDFLPENMEDALGFDFKDRLYQHMSANTAQGQTFYHGHAEGDEEKKEEVKRFLHHINKGLKEMFNHTEAPLIVASVDYIFSGFKRLTDYKNLLDENISTSPQGEKKSDLHEKSWNIIQKQVKKELEEDSFRYNETKNKTDLIEEIVLGAFQGRIDTLFVNKEAVEWGLFDEKAFSVKVEENPNPNAKELLNFAVINTYFTDGKVHFLEPDNMPAKNQKACAIYRY